MSSGVKSEAVGRPCGDNKVLYVLPLRVKFRPSWKLKKKVWVRYSSSYGRRTRRDPVGLRSSSGEQLEVQLWQEVMIVLAVVKVDSAG